MRKSLLLLTSLLVSTQIIAQEKQLPCEQTAKKLESTEPGQVVHLSSFVASKSQKRVEPKYPVAAARHGFEGYVQMSFVVDEQGNVIDPVVDDFSGHKDFKKEALRAVKRWKYTPAMQDGKPVQQCKQQVQFDFALYQKKQGATRRFVRIYKEAAGLLTEKKLEEADKLIQELHNCDLRNRYENAWLWKLDAYLARALKDNERELRSVGRAVSSARVGKRQGKILQDDELRLLYERKFALEVSFNQYAVALKTLETLSKVPDSGPVVEHLTTFADRVKTVIDSNGDIVIAGTLEKDKVWFHTLARSNFSFANIEGNVSEMELRCNSRREKFTVVADSIWQIPPSWGECRVMVNGDAGTSFSIVEIHDSQV